MRNRIKRNGIGVVIVIALMAQAMFACGPFFPNRVLIGGDNVVLKAPVASFSAELDRIKPPVPKHLAAVLPARTDVRYGEQSRSKQTANKDVDDLRQALDAGTMSAPEKEKLLSEYEAVRSRIVDYKLTRSRWQRMRSILDEYKEYDRPPPKYYFDDWAKQGLDPKSTTPPAYVPPVMPEHLPEEFALYLRGAIHYHAEAIPEAEAAWRALLQLPKGQRQYRSTWAAFMLGKLALKDTPAEACTYFRQVRAMAKAGFADSLGLASSGLGWEAQVKLRQAKLTQAMALYLAQHATGDPTAAASLQKTAREVLASETLTALVDDETTRKVTTAYLLAQGGPFTASPPAKTMKAWLAAVEQGKIDRVAEADRLAWAAYQAGDVRQADRWLNVADPDSHMTQWIHAKLLLRQGKVAEAVGQLRILVRQLPLAEEKTIHNELRSHDAWELVDGPLQEEVRGELGTLLLAREQFSEALDVLLKGGHWEDAAYIAERVLGADELKTYVDRCWPESNKADAKKKDAVDSKAPQWIAYRLRYLLARRLTRLGRWKESRPYYPAKWRARLDAYIQTLRRGYRKETPALQQAAALWEAAHIARHEGLELLGYELTPDCLIYSGRYPGYSMTKFRRELVQKNPLTALSKKEIERAKASVPPIDKRWHYRYVAAGHAWRAIARMPDNHELTAKMLWVAGSWLKGKDPKNADRFYKALALRCPETNLGKQAVATHWFPEAAIDEEKLTDAVFKHAGLPRPTKTSPAPNTPPASYDGFEEVDGEDEDVNSFTF